MLIEGGSVEAREGVRVGREVRRYPVEDHSDATLVQLVDERLELVGMTMPCGGGEVSGDLVSPRSPERVLGDGKQLDVRESHLADVIGEMTSRLFPGERTVAFLGHAAPRAEVHLVHGHWPAEWILRP